MNKPEANEADDLKLSAQDSAQWERLAQQAEREGELHQSEQDQAAAASVASSHTTLRYDNERSRRWQFYGLVLMGLALAWAVVKLWLPPPAPSPADLDAGRRALIKLLDDNLADYAQVHGGEYPKDIHTVLPLEVNVFYVRTSDGYQLAVDLSNGQRMSVQRP